MATLIANALTITETLDDGSELIESGDVLVFDDIDELEAYFDAIIGDIDADDNGLDAYLDGLADNLD